MLLQSAKRWLAAAVFFQTIAVTLTSIAQQPVRDIGSRRELFIDDWLIDTQTNVALTLHPAVPREVVLELSQAWAGPTTGFTAVMRDRDRFRFYYSNDSDGATKDATSYAESLDGVVWKRPSLGLLEFQGSKDNNLVWLEPSIHNFNPFRDENPAADETERYKALAGGPPRLFASADGVRWRQIQEKPVLLDGAHDSQNVAFWDALRGCYVAYARYSGNGVRHIRTSTSQDFRNWSPSQPIVFPPDVPREHLYTNAITPYFRAPHLYVGTPMRFVPDRHLYPEHAHKGVSDGVLITSRDGLHFERRFLESFIRPDLGMENWTDRTNLPTWGVVQTGPGEMSVYWVEHFRHPTVRLRRGSLRLDGFASLRASSTGGEVTTHALRFDGTRLSLNFQTSATGSLRVAVLKPDGTAYPEFEAASCMEMYGNDLDRTVTWKGKSDLRELVGKTVRLRFFLQNADLYALQFVK